MSYRSPLYICSVAILPITAALLWFFLKGRSKPVQKYSILLLMLLNTAQHFLKPILYADYRGTGFSSLISAYNMCSVLIISSPLVFLWGNRFCKNFIFFVGTVAGIGAVAVPFWYMGTPISQLGGDYARFYICHGLLFLSSLLPLLLGFHSPSYKEFWQVGLGFLLALAVILVNDFIFISLGLFPGAETGTLYQSLRKLNPCWVMGPPPELPWLKDLAAILTPKVFLGRNPSGTFAPLLWYAIPLYAAITAAAFGLFALIDRKQLMQDYKSRRV